jgi:hypothetical protein
MTAKNTKTTKTKKNVQPEEVLTLTSPEIVARTHKDMLYGALFLSVLVNLFFFIAWLVTRVTTGYDAEISSILFTR